MNMRCRFVTLVTLVASHGASLLAQPVIQSHPKTLTADAGSTVTLAVSASAPEQIEYQWHFNGTNIAGATGSSLQITNVSVTHLGTYGVRLKSSGEIVESNPATLSLFVTMTPDFDPRLSLRFVSNVPTLAWQGPGSLESAATLAGQWTNILGAQTSYTATATANVQFYRVRNPYPRNVRVFVPSSYRQEQPTPVIINFHGYLGSGQRLEEYLRMQAIAESHGFFYAYPDGIPNSEGYRFWNAANACCDFDDQNIDDSGFVKNLILRARLELNVDPKRVHIMGHSNGGFLAHRVAREHSELIASIASIAGVMDREDSVPPPKLPVHVLQVHGTGDDIVPYEGGLLRADVPRVSRRPPMTGAVETISRWAAWNACGSLQHDNSPSLDLVSTVSGLDTIVARAISCDGAEAELWSIENASHVPEFTSALATKVAEWLLAHPKP
jgi:polyhydroxybutyrate depolymerase